MTKGTAGGVAVEDLHEKEINRRSRAEFVWDFAALELDRNVDIEYYARAADCNPTGRGQTETPRTWKKSWPRAASLPSSRISSSA